MRELVLVGLALGLLSAGCAAGAPAQTGAGGDGGGDGGSGGESAGGGGDEGGGGGGGAAPCGTDLDKTGCPCTTGEAPRACFTGEPELAGQGVCTPGTQACIDTVQGELVVTAWGPCEGQGSPGQEACNGLDDDCDGTADDDCSCIEGSKQPCSSVCGGGEETCVNGQWTGCDAPAPAPDGTCTVVCNPAGDPPTAWEAFDFTYQPAQTPCAGERYVRYMDEYGLWVGAVLCTPVRYKLFLSPSKIGTFHQIGDFAGNGQDHCEIVNDAFTIPNEDDVQSGGCAACAVGPIIWSDPGLGPGFSRATFGTCFTFEPQWPQFNLHSTQWYECGVSIP